MSGLGLGDGVGDVGITGTRQLGMQDALGDLQHSPLGHPHHGIGHQPGALGALQARGQQEKVDWNVSNAALMETDFQGKRIKENVLEFLMHSTLAVCSKKWLWILHLYPSDAIPSL